MQLKRKRVEQLFLYLFGATNWTFSDMIYEERVVYSVVPLNGSLK